MKIQGGIKIQRIFQPGILHRFLCSLLLNGIYEEIANSLFLSPA